MELLIIISLILAGIILMFAEMLLIPGVGIAGFLSLASFAASCWYAFAKISTSAGIIVTAIVLVIVLILFAIILRGKTWKRLALKDEIDTRTNTDADSVKAGDLGITKTRLAPMGTVNFGSVTCEATSADNTMLGPGIEVEAVAVEDGKILVKPTNKQ